MRNLVIRTHVSWYPQFLLALLRSRLTCDMVTNFNWENMIRGKYTCALIFTIAIKENFIQLWRKVFVHLVTYAIMNSWLLIAQPNCWHIDSQRMLQALFKCILSYHEQFPQTSLIFDQSLSFCLFQSQRWSTVFYSWLPFSGLPMRWSPATIA